jgi:4-methylaminobutanoate oxidase (formaldehyde-forming)
MAEWIVGGEPSLDLHDMNVRRFGTQFAHRPFFVERSREAYKYYYYLRFPRDEHEWGRPQFKSALYSRLQDLGAVFGEKNGWERANYFDPTAPSRRAGADQRSWGWGRPPYFDLVGEEHRAARERVALFDMSSFGKLEVSGPGALSLLQRLSVSDLDTPLGKVTYTQFLNTRGGIESDVTIARLDTDRFRIISGTAFTSNDLGWIQMHLPLDGSVEVRDVTGDLACLGLWGPYARELLRALTTADLSNAGSPYMRGHLIDVSGVEVWAQRISYVGELGWELYIAVDQAVCVWDAIMEAGQRYGIRAAGYRALESLRLEKGYRYWSADITPADNPYSAGLGFCVSLEKQDFIGRDALMRFKSEGLTHKLCAMIVECHTRVLYGGEAVLSGQDIVGRVRSGGFGYTLGATVAYAYLPPALAKAGTRLQVEMFGECMRARVVSSPQYDPEGLRPRADG